MKNRYYPLIFLIIITLISCQQHESQILTVTQEKPTETIFFQATVVPITTIEWLGVQDEQYSYAYPADWERSTADLSSQTRGTMTVLSGNNQNILFIQEPKLDGETAEQWITRHQTMESEPYLILPNQFEQSMYQGKKMISFYSNTYASYTNGTQHHLIDLEDHFLHISIQGIVNGNDDITQGIFYSLAFDQFDKIQTQPETAVSIREIAPVPPISVDELEIRHTTSFSMTTESGNEWVAQVNLLTGRWSPPDWQAADIPSIDDIEIIIENGATGERIGRIPFATYGYPLQVIPLHFTDTHFYARMGGHADGGCDFFGDGSALVQFSLSDGTMTTIPNSAGGSISFTKSNALIVDGKVLKLLNLETNEMKMIDIPSEIHGRVGNPIWLDATQITVDVYPSIKNDEKPCSEEVETVLIPIP